MSFRPTAVLQGARRHPLTSKQAGKSFYKGTGNHPGLPPKRQGRHAPGQAGRQYQLNEELIRTFVVPDNLHTTRLRPYVEDVPLWQSTSRPEHWMPSQRKGSPKTTTLRYRGLFDDVYFKQLLESPKVARPPKERHVWTPADEHHP